SRFWMKVGCASASTAAAPAAAGAAAVDAEAHPTFIQNREVAVLNLFTGFVGVLAAVTLAVHGDANDDNAAIRGAAYTLLFAFTYLWVAYNNYVGAGGHAFGWYCLFVAATAVFAGAYTFSNADGNDASIYLGVSWLAWAVLWFLFFVLLALERPIAKVTGALAVVEGIGTGWIFGLLLLEGELAF
ncbi:MAG: AmiS/UreI family transporter, partial [Solirubrobacteraceae bacterium]